MDGRERNEHQTPCPRCGAEAEWSFFDAAKMWVEILCADCGRYEMTREEFDLAAVEIADTDQADRS